MWGRVLADPIMPGMTGCTGAMWPVSLESCVIRGADEGIPIGAIKRIFCASQINVDVRDLVAQGVASGRLVAPPAEDWPALVPRDARRSMVRPHVSGEDDDELILKMARTLKTTKLESRVFMVLLRRGLATHKMLHDAVEFNRGNPANPTDEKIVDVVICKLRKKLELFGFSRPTCGIDTVHSIGYDMTDAHREKVWAIIRGEETCH